MKRAISVFGGKRIMKTASEGLPHMGQESNSCYPWNLTLLQKFKQQGLITSCLSIAVGKEKVVNNINILNWKFSVCSPTSYHVDWSFM